MDGFNNTIASFNQAVPMNNFNLAVTIFDGPLQPITLSLQAYGKSIITFGRNNTNDIVLSSPVVSREHGRFVFINGQWYIEDKAFYAGTPSKNGLICNNTYIVSRPLCDGDFIRIDDGVETIAEGILFVFSAQDSGNSWYTLPMAGRNEVRIGRDPGCDIVLPHLSVSRYHAKVSFENGHYYITDKQSTNGVLINNKRITGKQLLHEKDIINITNSKLIFSSGTISYCCYTKGISVDVSKVIINRGKGKKVFTTCNNVSLGIKPGELVSIIGGSGAGKSTVLNCMCGYLPPTQGEVFINGIDLYRNFDSLKKLVGYVPQSDIVYDNLTLYDMLSYTAKLRLSPDISETERENAITKAIQLVELTEKRNSFIKNLSGGQKKRASIAVELLSDPNLLFLDEPASGLDPGTERNLMHSLRQMANSGKTVILVTHSTLQLKLCDKIIFMGKGGRLCFYGSYDEALRFFGVSDVVDVYNMITDNPVEWSQKFESSRAATGVSRTNSDTLSSVKHDKKLQLPVLCARYFKLVLNDRQRLLLLVLQAPVLALLISVVANGDQFYKYSITKSLLFALSCSGFWIGILNAIQEICKERSIMKREYMTGLSLNSYIASKILVLGAMCLVQSILIVTTFAILVGLPDDGVIGIPYIELLITTFLTALSATAMGLFVSSLFTNADRAMTVAPILLMPQILFSGLIFKLEGFTECISWFAVCRWSMEGYGTTADLNHLPMDSIQVEKMGTIKPVHAAESFYDFTAGHLLCDWLILALFVIGFLVLARIVLNKISKETA